MDTILVIGGTGRVGLPVVRALLHAGYKVRLLTRNPDQARARIADPVEWYSGDLRSPDSLSTAMKGVSAVYLNLPETGDPRAAFISELHGVDHVLNVVPRDVLILKLSEIDAMETPHFFDLTLKYRAEERIRQSGNPYMIFRPTWFMESLPLVLTQKNRLFYIGEQPSPLYWIAGRDYAAQVVTALGKRDETINRTWTIQGAEAISFSEAAHRYAQAVGGGLRVTQLPLWVLRLGGLFDAQQRANYELMAHYNRRREVFVSADTWQVLGKPTTTLEEFAALWKTSESVLRR